MRPTTATAGYTPAEETFLAGAARLGLSLNPSQLEQFRTYFGELAAWNRRFNLTAITDYDQALSRHFLDSLTPLPIIRAAGASTLIDVGSGAGFPGLPLLIACPRLRVTLLDSMQKRIAFCRHIAGTLALEPRLVTARAEEAGRDPTHREAYDITVCRAVDRLAVLAEYLLPFCRTGGLAIAMKKGRLGDELAQAERAVAQLGGVMRDVIPVDPSLGLGDDRFLVVIEKTRPTPKAYPRRPGVPRKRPLLVSTRFSPPVRSTRFSPPVRSTRFSAKGGGGATEQQQCGPPGEAGE